MKLNEMRPLTKFHRSLLKCKLMFYFYFFQRFTKMNTLCPEVAVMSTSKTFRSRGRTTPLASSHSSIWGVVQAFLKTLSLSMTKNMLKTKVGTTPFTTLRHCLKTSLKLKRLKSSKRKWTCWDHMLTLSVLTKVSVPQKSIKHCLSLIVMNMKEPIIS